MACLTMRKAVSSITAIVLLIIATVAIASLLYIWSTGYLSTQTSQIGKPPTTIVIDEGNVAGSTLTLYIRNMGSTSVTVKDFYLISTSGKVIKLEPAIASIKPSEGIWGGDVWVVKPNTLELVRTVKGLIVNDKFSDPNPAVWDDAYVDYNNAWSHIYYDPDGLKLLSISDDDWAVRGLITMSQIINLQNLPVVIEVDLQKTNYNVPYGDAAGSPFAACLYLSPNKNPNPYYATPWFAAKLYPRAYPSRTEAQLVTRSARVELKTLYTWYSAPNTQPRGIFLLIFNETNKVYYYFWRDSRTGKPYASGSWASTGLSQVFSSGQLYVYLTIDNTVTESSRKVHVRYIQVYRGTELTVKGLQPGWVVQLIKDSEVVAEKVATGNSVTFDLLDIIIDKGMPIDAIKVITYEKEGGGWTIEPGEVKAVKLDISNVPPGLYTVKAVAEDGSIAVYHVKIKW